MKESEGDHVVVICLADVSQLEILTRYDATAREGATVHRSALITKVKGYRALESSSMLKSSVCVLCQQKEPPSQE